MARKILITSGKGGVGKTSTVANLGAMLAKMGYRVCLVDMDFGLNNLDVIMGIENRINYDIIDAVSNRCRIKQALVETDIENLYVIACLKSFERSQISGQSIKLLLDTLSVTFDYFILDCPAGIDNGFHRAVAVCDEAICIATPQIASLRDTDKVISILRGYNLNRISVVLNRVRGDLVIEKKCLSPREIEGILKTELVGIIPESDLIFLNKGGMLSSNSTAYKAYKLLAKNIDKGDNKLFDCTKNFSGLWGGLKRRLKKTV